MTTITNNKLPEWRTALDKCVENYQSTRAWYEENRDSPAALDDMERAEDQLANFVRKCGFSIVLSLLDEIDELQELRRNYLALRGEIEDVQSQLYEAENQANEYASELQERRRLDGIQHAVCEVCGVPCNNPNHPQMAVAHEHSAQPVPVVPDEMATSDDMNLYQKSFAQGYNACRAAMLQGVEQPQNARQNIPENIPDGNSPAIPDDWVMVPKEPTQAMIKAWLSEVANWRGHVAGYKAALAAAPQHEVK